LCCCEAADSTPRRSKTNCVDGTSEPPIYEFVLVYRWYANG
jgi:hypothetical protein